jgi:hypothetical protein
MWRDARQYVEDLASRKVSLAMREPPNMLPPGHDVSEAGELL